MYESRSSCKSLACSGVMSCDSSQRRMSLSVIVFIVADFFGGVVSYSAIVVEVLFLSSEAVMVVFIACF